jgi:hypothetical protein
MADKDQEKDQDNKEELDEFVDDTPSTETPPSEKDAGDETPPDEKGESEGDDEEQELTPEEEKLEADFNKTWKEVGEDPKKLFKRFKDAQSALGKKGALLSEQRKARLSKEKGLGPASQQREQQQETTAPKPLGFTISTISGPEDQIKQIDAQGQTALDGLYAELQQAKVKAHEEPEQAAKEEVDIWRKIRSTENHVAEAKEGVRREAEKQVGFRRSYGTNFADKHKDLAHPAVYPFYNATMPMLWQELHEEAVEAGIDPSSLDPRDYLGAHGRHAELIEEQINSFVEFIQERGKKKQKEDTDTKRGTHAETPGAKQRGRSKDKRTPDQKEFEEFITPD